MKEIRHLSKSNGRFLIGVFKRLLLVIFSALYWIKKLEKTPLWRSAFKVLKSEEMYFNKVWNWSVNITRSLNGTST